MLWGKVAIRIERAPPIEVWDLLSLNSPNHPTPPTHRNKTPNQALRRHEMSVL